MRAPLVVRRPFAGRDEDGEFVEPVRQRRVEADIFAHLPQPVRELGAAQPGIEGAGERLARARHDRFGDLLLLGLELWEPVAGPDGRYGQECGGSEPDDVLHGDPPSDAPGFGGPRKLILDPEGADSRGGFLGGLWCVRRQRAGLKTGSAWGSRTSRYQP